jgi:steroid delta-isomerase-like uncharacterized protein
MPTPGDADLLRELVRAFNTRNFDRVYDLVSGDCEFVDVAAGSTARGPREIVIVLRTWAAAFRDMELEPLRVVTTEQGAAGEFVGRGTHSGPLASPGGEIPATGNAVEVRFSVVADASGGKLTGFRQYYDTLTMMAQLGLVPGAG